MHRFRVFAFIAALTVLFSCSENNDPVSPQDNSVTIAGVAVVDECGEAAYLNSLSPILTEWRDSIHVWLGGEFLDETPAYTEESDEETYIQELIPALSQWEMAVNDSLDSTVVDTPPAYEDEDTPGTYLSKLSPMVDQWHGALEDFRGEEFLADPPVYTPDETAPVITCPADTTIECADTSGFAVEFDAIVEDDCDPSPQLSCDYESGAVFLIGETLVTCTATDASGNTSECSFTVTVVEAEPPVIKCPADTTVECTGDGSAVVEFEVTVESKCDSNVVAVCDPPSGSSFPLGETVVNCSATDRFGNTVECSLKVYVEDTTPPTIDFISVSKSYLWPPNHRMHDVMVMAEATDICDSAPVCYVYDVTSDEPINGTGDGNTEPDYEIVADNMVRLRAERAGPQDGRVYTIHVRCEDASGNSADGTIEVIVPHDRGHAAMSDGRGAEPDARR
jgi:hypothetical protein